MTNELLVQELECAIDALKTKLAAVKGAQQAFDDSQAAEQHIAKGDGFSLFVGARAFGGQLRVFCEGGKVISVDIDMSENIVIQQLMSDILARTAERSKDLLEYHSRASVVA